MATEMIRSSPSAQTRMIAAPRVAVTSSICTVSSVPVASTRIETTRIETTHLSSPGPVKWTARSRSVNCGSRSVNCSGGRRNGARTARRIAACPRPLTSRTYVVDDVALPAVQPAKLLKVASAKELTLALATPATSSRSTATPTTISAATVAAATTMSTATAIATTVSAASSMLAPAKQLPVLSTIGPMPVTFQAGAGVRKRRILCYGDSLTVGFCEGGLRYEPYGRAMVEPLCSSLGGLPCEVSVCGHSGHSAREMVANLDSPAVADIGGMIGKGLRRILEDDAILPDVVVIMAGTNDLGRENRTAQQVFEDLVQLHSECHRRGVRTVALAPPPAPRAPAGTPFETSRRQLSTLLMNWSRSTVGVNTCIDANDLVPAFGHTKVPGSWDEDELHFSPSGSRLLGQRLAQQLRPLLLHT